MDQVRNCGVAIGLAVWECDGNFSDKSHKVGEEEIRAKKRREGTRRGEDRRERKSREEKSRKKERVQQRGEEK